MLLGCFPASQPVPPAPSPSSLNPDSSCSEANIITLFSQCDDAQSLQIRSLIKPPGVYSLLATLCRYVEPAEGRRGERACLALEHTLYILPVRRLALAVGHSLKPQPPAEVERAWDASEEHRDTIGFDRICTTN